MKKEVVEAIRQPFPNELIKTRTDEAGATVTYVEGKSYIDKLNAIFDCDWSFEILNQEIKIIENHVVVWGKLTVLPTEKNGLPAGHPIVKTCHSTCGIEWAERWSVIKEKPTNKPKGKRGRPSKKNAKKKEEDGVKGEGKEEEKMVCDRYPRLHLAIVGAETNALKGCCHRLGIGLHLFESSEAYSGTPGTPPPAESRLEKIPEAEKKVSDLQKTGLVDSTNRRLGIDGKDKMKPEAILAAICKQEGITSIGELSYDKAGEYITGKLKLEV